MSKPELITEKVKFLKPLGGFAYHTGDEGVITLPKPEMEKAVKGGFIEILKVESKSTSKSGGASSKKS